MPFRQMFTLLLALIAIVGAALFVLSWDGDDGDDTATDVIDTDDEPATTTSSSTSTTTSVAPVTTSIPVECGSTGDTTEAETTTTSTSTTTTTTTTTIAGEDNADEEPDVPLVPTLGRNSSLTTNGLDQVSFGLTLRQATVAAGTEFDPCGPVDNCYRVTPVEAPPGIVFVVHEGTIERVDIVGDSPITTRSGAGIGTTTERLDELFGEQLERVDLGGGAVDVIFVPTSENDSQFRVAFTTVDGVVETMRAGRMPLVLEADPCA